MASNLRLLYLTLLLMATTTIVSSFTIPKGDAVQEVKQALEGQIAAWNKGDLETAMGFYWNSPEMLWISKGGTEKGYQEVYDMFLQDFTDRSKMGVYSYEPLHIEQVSREAVFFVFRWKIELDGKRLMGGVSSQVWKKLNGRWVVTSEHAS
ncbi:nuclear transport factor 2 family protein [Pontibacter sp. BT310]|uniref:Nuclear transport factor 2 family protein n=2 Tax=Hymenobacteraceae TaxID=1853232 RepID=A0ABS6X797_9BACT|nr:nuclear transport factor 2 family protein [Pontibacter sp. BT310]MBW3363870.1 nuclear transport factor 2 family protein [Pontibacter populi]